MAANYAALTAGLALPAAVGLIFFGWLLRRQPAALLDTPDRQQLRIGDTILASVITAFFLSAFLQQPDEPAVLTRNLVILSGAMYLALAFFISIFLLVRKLNPVRVFGLAPRGFPAKARFAVLSMLAVCPAVILVSTALRPWAPIDDRNQEIVRFFASNPDISGKLAVLVLAVFVAPLTEELIFRGYLYGVLRRIAGRWSALLVSSALFALVHGHFPSMPALFSLSLVLTVIYERTATLWCPILAHATFNALSLVLITAFPTEVS